MDQFIVESEKKTECLNSFALWIPSNFLTQKAKGLGSFQPLCFFCSIAYQGSGYAIRSFASFLPFFQLQGAHRVALVPNVAAFNYKLPRHTRIVPSDETFEIKTVYNHQHWMQKTSKKNYRTKASHHAYVDLTALDMSS
jgi:hypothetical protein